MLIKALLTILDFICYNKSMESNITYLDSYRKLRIVPEDITTSRPPISDELDPAISTRIINPERQAIIDEFARNANISDDSLAQQNGGRLLRLVSQPEPPDSAA